MFIPLATCCGIQIEMEEAMKGWGLGGGNRQKLIEKRVKVNSLEGDRDV